MLITKADGTQETFKPAKLRASLRRAGARKHEIDTIVTDVERGLIEGEPTQAIYRKAFSLLRETEEPIAAKYSLRRAVFGLGPTGFPFEDFLAKLFEFEGYTTRRRVLIAGKCATHEVDIAAYKPDHSFVAEAKFHARPGIKSDLQVAMYSYARYLDLKSHKICRADQCGIDDLYVITNTKFTTAAKKYAECTGIRLLSWNHPNDDSLQARIERAGLYPITVITKLSTRQKQQLLESGIILCKELLSGGDMLRSIGLSHSKIDDVHREAGMLCGS